MIWILAHGLPPSSRHLDFTRVFDDIGHAARSATTSTPTKHLDAHVHPDRSFMVYLGLPSAGCELCRKAKKRCGLEQPACARCIRLKKACSGYRNLSQFEIQNESEAVMLRVTGRRRSLSSHTSVSSAETHATSTQPGTTIPFLPSRDVSMDLPVYDVEEGFDLEYNGIPHVAGWTSELRSRGASLTYPIHPNPGDIAMNHFLKHFVSADSGIWQVLRGYATEPNIDPCLDLAIRACGMAALYNVENVAIGKRLCADDIHEGSTTLKQGS